MSNPILNAKDISITFGALKAVTDFNLEIKENELVGLIGPNGAGKTTIFNLLTGVYKPTDGSFIFDGEELAGKSAIDINKKGIARTFQNIRLFGNMSVLDNVKVGLHNSESTNLFDSIFRTPKYRKEEKNITEKALELLDVFGLKEEANFKASNLPYGKQRKLEIARALGTNPKLLLLDEPAAGMNPAETAELMETIALVRNKFGISILLIEHDMSLVMGICERLVVLEYGRVIADGLPDEVVHNPRVVSTYLGE